VRFGLPSSKAVFDTITRSAPAFSHQIRLPSTKRPRKVAHGGVPFLAQRKRHGWAFLDEGAQRAASKRRIRSSSESGSPVIERGDQRSTKSGSISCSGWRCSRASISS
jgi:hypothetical protein